MSDSAESAFTLRRLRVFRESFLDTLSMSIFQYIVLLIPFS